MPRRFEALSAALRGKPAPDDPAGLLRLFFALLPDPAARQALAALAREIARETGGRATPAENLHLTLAFLGSVPRSRVAEAEAVGARVAATAEPFALALDRVGWFRKAGVAWAGPTEDVPALGQVAGALRDALHAAGFTLEERAFHPHLTLARRAARAPAEAVAAVAPAAWHADAMVLMASETLPSGAAYRVLASWRLGDRAYPQPAP
jgi:RNA 2',3'-cyclic 3'-phosphodiesterase